jgi:carbamoyltransferase
VRGEPIVCTPLDAIRCFLATQIDVLVLGRFIVHRQFPQDRLTYTTEQHLARFEPD